APSFACSPHLYSCRPRRRIGFRQGSHSFRHSRYCARATAPQGHSSARLIWQGGRKPTMTKGAPMSQQDEFQERLGRILSQGQRTGAAAPAYGRTTPGKSVPAGDGIAVNLLYPLSLAAAFLIGILAVGLGRYIRFHLADGTAGDQTTDLDLLITAGFGMAASFVLAQMFRLSSKQHVA